MSCQGMLLVLVASQGEVVGRGKLELHHGVGNLLFMRYWEFVMRRIVFTSIRACHRPGPMLMSHGDRKMRLLNKAFVWLLRIYWQSRK